MDVVAIVGLARSAEDEAQALAADLGLTPYETGVMLRAPMPVIVLRSEDRARTVDLLAKLRSRRHEAVAFELDAVVSSDVMFHPKSFRFEASDLIGIGNGEEKRLPMASIFALVRANHLTRSEATVKTQTTKFSLGRAAMTGGLLPTKTTTTESKRVADEREAVLYVFRSDGAPWLLRSTLMLYDGLGAAMRVSKVENFEVLLKTLRELAPSAPFDARLLAVRPAPAKVTAAGANHFSASSSGTIDLLAHVVAMTLGQAARPYR